MANTTGLKFGGRTKGTPNRTTKETKELLTKIVSNELDNVDKLLEQLEPKERLDAVIKLLPYIVPKQTEMTMEGKEHDFTPIIIEIAETEDIKAIINNFEKEY